MDEVLTVKEVSKILKVNIDYVHRLRKSGLLKFMRLGCYKCTRGSLNSFLEEFGDKDISKLLISENQNERG